MNKRILTVAVAALALAACSKNETVEVAASKAIGFDAFAGKVTRAVNDVTKETLSTFYVFGGYSEDGTITGTPNVFVNTQVTNNLATAEYWVPGKTYKFAAYKDGDNKLADNAFDNGVFAITDYEAGANDLILALPDDVTTPATVEEITDTDPGKVGLTFDHLLAKVGFTFRALVAEGYTIEISNLKFTAPNVGDYTSETEEWTLDGETTAEKVYTLENGAVVGTPATSDECYVIPQSPAQLTASFTATLKYGEEEIITKNFESCSLAGVEEWTKGYAYNYAAEITEEDMEINDNRKITFTVTEVNPFVDQNVTGDIAQ